MTKIVIDGDFTGSIEVDGKVILDNRSAAIVTSVGDTVRTLDVDNYNDIKSALFSVGKPQQPKTIKLNDNIDVSNKALVLTSRNGVTIDGNGKRILRNSGQYAAHLLRISNCSVFNIKNLYLSDGDDGKHGPIGSKTPHMILIDKSKDVTIEDSRIAHSKGYMLYIRGVDGFTLVGSTIRDAGVLGVYVGHNVSTMSRRVIIKENDFIENATNALALLGVGGSVENRVIDNQFNRNHIYGRWPVAPQYGTGFTGGGQLFIAMAHNLLVANNHILNGECLNGYHKAKGIPGKGDVSGIEIGQNVLGEPRVFNTVITSNTITNNDSHAIHKNRNAKLDKSTVISSNILTGNGRGNKVSAEGALVN